MIEGFQIQSLETIICLSFGLGNLITNQIFETYSNNFKTFASNISIEFYLKSNSPIKLITDRLITSEVGHPVGLSVVAIILYGPHFFIG